MGPRKCCAPGCQTQYGQGLLLRRFPSDSVLKSRWLEAFPSEGKENLPSKCAAVCELHFTENQFEAPREDGRKKLRSCAVPTVWSTEPVSEQSNTDVDISKESPKRKLSDHSYWKKTKPVETPKPSCRRKIVLGDRTNKICDHLYSKTAINSPLDSGVQSLDWHADQVEVTDISSKPPSESPATGSPLSNSPVESEVQSLDLQAAQVGVTVFSTKPPSESPVTGSPLSNSPLDSGVQSLDWHADQVEVTDISSKPPSESPVIGSPLSNSPVESEVQSLDLQAAQVGVTDVSTKPPSGSPVTGSPLSDSLVESGVEILDLLAAQVEVTDISTKPPSGSPVTGSPLSNSPLDSGVQSLDWHADQVEVTDISSKPPSESPAIGSPLSNSPVESEVQSLDLQAAQVGVTDVSTKPPSGSPVTVSPLSCENIKELDDHSYFRHATTSLPVFAESFCATSDTFEEVEQTSKNLCLTPRSTEGYSRDQLESLAYAQRREIARLREENRKQDKCIRSLERTLKTHNAIKRKYNVVRTSYQRLEEKHNAYLRSKFPGLTEAQLRGLQGKKTRGYPWGSAEARDGLVLKMRCGTSGYEAFVKKLPLLPSIRSLQRYVQFVLFESGFFPEIFDLMEEQAKVFSERDKQCGIVVDAMAIKPEERYDPSTKKMIGKATLPTHSGLADKALVIMLVGLFVRWKVIIGYYLTGKRSPQYSTDDTGKAMADIVLEAITKSENIGYNVHFATGDMGPDNQSWWKHLGIAASREGPVVYSFPNPVRSDAVVCVIPDGIHLYKSIKTMIESNKIVTLSPDIVASEKLPTDEVRYEHIEGLCAFESPYELKVAYRLDERNLHCKEHFDKMKVGTSRAVVCHRTGVGLKKQAEKQQKPALIATSWFIMLLDTFFKIITSRHEGTALSQRHPSAYKKALDCIDKVARVFRQMRVGIAGAWKPAQRGILILCASILHLQDYFLIKEGAEKGYIYLLLSHLMQDCIENLFSVLRLGQPLPNALIFKQHLKVVCLGMYNTIVKNSNYDFAGGEYLVDPLSVARKRAAARSVTKLALSTAEIAAHPLPSLSQEDFDCISEWELDVIYDMAGCTLHYLRKSLKAVCPSCFDALLWKGPQRHPNSTLVMMKEFVAFKRDERGEEIAQVLVSEDCFLAILTAEAAYRKTRDMLSIFKSTDVIDHLVNSVMYVWDGCGIPECHDICRKLLCAYIRARMNQFGKQMRTKNSVRQSVDRSSKSIAMRQAVRNV